MPPSSSPIRRVPLPTDVSDSVNYLQSFMQSQSSSVDPRGESQPGPLHHAPAWSSPSPRWGSASYAENQDWPSSAGVRSHSTSLLRNYTSAQQGLLGSDRHSAVSPPLRSMYASSAYAEGHSLSPRRASPSAERQRPSLRYGWQHTADHRRDPISRSHLSFGDDSRRTTSAFAGRPRAFDEAARTGPIWSATWGYSSSLGGMGAGADTESAWRRPPPSPVDPHHDDMGSMRSGGGAINEPRRRALYSTPPTAHRGQQDGSDTRGLPRSRVPASPQDHRFASRQPTQISTPRAAASASSALPPRAPSASSRGRPSSTPSVMPEETEAEEAGAYEVVIDVDDPVEDDDQDEDAYPEEEHGRAKREATGEEEEAYEKLDVEAAPPQRSPRRHAPDPPSTRRRAAANPAPSGRSPPRALLSVPHSLAQQSHDENLRDVACYLKNYFACDAAESQKGLETMLPEDVLGLVQCLYVDLYRVVRTARSSLNLPTHMFTDGDPADALLIPATGTALGSVAPSADEIRSRSPSQTSMASAQSSVCAAPLPPRPLSTQYETLHTSPRQGRRNEPVQMIEAIVPAFRTTPATAAQAKPNPSSMLNTSAAPSSSAAATRTLSPEQALAGSPSPPYRTSSGTPVATRSATTTPRRRPAAMKRATDTRDHPRASATRPVPTARTSAAPSTSSLASSPSASTSRSASANAQTDVPLPPIAKRPLKALMPHLREGAHSVKHSSSLRAPHLRWFQVQDCVDTFHGRDVLMPHLTWARSPSEASHVTTDTAYNLVGLESVAVGAGKTPDDKAWKLFKRKKGRVVDHKGHLIPTGMCVVLQFSGKKPIGMSFLSEEARQTWVGALMGVVERNRTITAKTQVAAMGSR